MNDEQEINRIETLHSDRLLSAASLFLEKNHRIGVINPSTKREVKSLIVAVDYTLRTSKSDIVINNLANIRSQLIMFSKKSETSTFMSHEYLNLKDGTIERAAQVVKQSADGHLHDTVSAEKIQTLLQDQKVSHSIMYLPKLIFSNFYRKGYVYKRTGR